MKAVNSDEFQLSSGKRFYAHRLMLGISRNEVSPSGFDVGYGADGDIYFENFEHLPYHFSREERIEIVDYVIEMWNELKAKI